jgi:hypothetical protein
VIFGENKPISTTTNADNTYRWPNTEWWYQHERRHKILR